MKREELEALGLTKEAIDQVMALHGKDIEGHKTKIEELTGSSAATQKQLKEANDQIEAFKGMDVEGVKKAAGDWQAKYEQATKDAAAQRVNHAFEMALTGAKVKNVKAATALFNMDQIKMNDDGTLAGFDEQLAKVKTDNAYLFEQAEVPAVTPKKAVPKIVTRAESQPVQGDAVMETLAKAAGVDIKDVKTK